MFKLGFVGKTLGLVLLLAVLAVAGGLLIYGSDYGIEATVTEKNCTQAQFLAPTTGSSGSTVTVVTKMFSRTVVVDVSADKCAVISEGNFVIYHIRTERTTIYESEGGSCIYDSETGPC